MNIKLYIKHPGKLVRAFGNRGLLNWMPDEYYLKLLYRAEMGKKLDLKNPKTFNEKLQWLKLYDRNPEYTMMVDKFEVRKYIKEKIGEEYLIPLVGGPWNNAEEIDWDSLPNRFVLKCTHGSHSNIVCTDKSRLDIESSKKQLNKWIKESWFWFGREWPYKDVKPKITAEKYMKEELKKTADDGLIDYKFYCFNGKPEFAYVSQGLDNHETASISYVSLDWKQEPFGRSDYKQFEELPEKPVNLEKMLQLAKVLSEGIRFLRVDFYEINGEIYFGELTFFPGCGFTEFSPEEWNYKIGSLIDLKRLS